MPFLGTTGGGSVRQFGGLANLGYFINNSLRFRASASGYLNRTPSASDRTTWTWSAWVKRGTISTQQYLFQARIDDSSNDTNKVSFFFNSDNTLNLFSQVTVFRKTNAVFRDPAAWYHIVLVADTSNATANNRFRLYINSVEQTYQTLNNPSSALTTAVNSANPHYIASEGGSTFFDGYMAEINFIDGQALSPSSFGKTDGATGQWVPKKFGGTYGTNGFYLKFADASAATAAAIGKDSSGNGNNWTPNNISVTAGVTYDAMIDSPTLSAAASNYCVMNPLDAATAPSDGNLRFVTGGSNLGVRSTIQLPTSGKFYAECTLGTTTSASVGEAFGYATASASLTGTPGSSGKYVIYADSSGYIYSNGSTLTSSLGTFASDTILQIAYDGTTGNAWVGKNNTWYNSSGGTTGDPSTGANPTFTSLSSVFAYVQGINGTQYFNAGQTAFSYTPPSGFKSLNTFNLP